MLKTRKFSKISKKSIWNCIFSWKHLQISLSYLAPADLVSYSCRHFTCYVYIQLTLLASLVLTSFQIWLYVLLIAKRLKKSTHFPKIWWSQKYFHYWIWFSRIYCFFYVFRKAVGNIFLKNGNMHCIQIDEVCWPWLEPVPSRMYRLVRQVLFFRFLPICHWKFVPGFHGGKMSHSKFLLTTEWLATAGWLRLL